MAEEFRHMAAELHRVPAGEQFDATFVRRMIPHHNSGLVEFLEPQSQAVHPQLRVAVTSGIITQEVQIADLRTWLSGRGRIG